MHESTKLAALQALDDYELKLHGVDGTRVLNFNLCTYVFHNLFSRQRWLIFIKMCTDVL